MTVTATSKGNEGEQEVTVTFSKPVTGFTENELIIQKPTYAENHAQSPIADQARAGDVGVGVGHGSSVNKKRAFRMIRHATRNGTSFLFHECKVEGGKHGSIDRT